MTADGGVVMREGQGSVFNFRVLFCILMYHTREFNKSEFYFIFNLSWHAMSLFLNI